MTSKMSGLSPARICSLYQVICFSRGRSTLRFSIAHANSDYHMLCIMQITTILAPVFITCPPESFTQNNAINVPNKGRVGQKVKYSRLMKIPAPMWHWYLRTRVSPYFNYF